MKVYLCYKCIISPNTELLYTEELIEKVVDTEVKALTWKLEFPPTEYEWRDYVVFDVE